MKPKVNSKDSIQVLEEKIIDLNLKLNNQKNAFETVFQTNKKLLNKLTHNLKNPAGVILSFSEMILEDLESYSPEKLNKHLNVIKKSAEFSVQLLNKINEFTRLQSPTLVLLFKNLNYIKLLNKIIDQFNAIAEQRNITITRKFPANEIEITLDEDAVKQSLTNIIDNAFRYSGENTTITISVIENSKNIETVISDEGIGISEEDLPNVFNPFFVAKTYSNDHQKCIGLGLAIADKIILHHHGKNSASSTIDKGSSFKITLPKKQP